MTMPPAQVVERAARVLASTSAALVRPYDVVGTTTRLLIAAADATGATSGGLILRRPGEEHVNLLAATSHGAQELEAFQVQVGQGPCFQAVETGEPATALSGAEMSRQWPVLANAFAQYGSAHASPLLWHGEAIGALNLFWRVENGPAAGAQDLMRAFADLATLAIIHAGPVDGTTVLQRTRQALDERTVIEQAKGVVAQQLLVTPEAAFAVLLQIADRENKMVGAIAARVIEEAAAAVAEQ